ncbi:LuxR C-terminal-related transcriptional regulator [Actinokineospora auranticolor]|uniref:Regulatory LuxR family protein n=1 Tax=Actinokineospora auranticolor TaxID=155976 RepID=A0A2S6H1T5_9PSEU|nr:LuxR C-terminal-related transcriptional regulator [Actinokineospora auranticolor]PPK71423.1 regulatory LuxR family protein [Actinokineospora auranticolor]
MTHTDGSARLGDALARTDSVRAAELALLLAAVFDPDAPGRVIAVVGEPGSGKTHLLGVLVRERQWSERPATVHQCARRGPGTGRATMDQVRTLLRRARRADEREVAVVSRLRPRRSTRELVVIDDAHLADEATVAELCDMAAGTTAPLADVVIALRGRQTPAHLDEALRMAAVYGQAVRVDLGPLSDEQLLAVSPAPLDARRRSAGNPFALLALQALDESARLGTDTAVAPYEFAVLRETRDLTLNERVVLHAAAVLRSRFDRDLLAEVAEVDPLVVAASVESLARRDLLRPDQGDRLSLRDDVFGTLLHRTIDPCWSARAHQRAIQRLTARGLAERELGFHLVNSLSRAREGELARIVAAAGELTSGDITSAISWLTSVLTEAPLDSEVGVSARLALSGALAQVGRVAESRELLFTVHDAGTADPVELSRQVAAVAVVEGVLGHDVQVMDLLTERLRGTASTDPGRPALVLANAFREHFAGWRGEPTPLDGAIEAARGHGDHLVAAGLLAIRALEAIPSGRVREATDDLTAAGELVDRAPEHQLAAALPTVVLLSLGSLYSGRYPEARRYLVRGVGVANARQQQFLLPTLHVLLSEAERQLGRLRPAYDAADDAIIESGGNNHRHAQALALKSLAEVWREAPGDGRARVLAQQALAQQSVPWGGINGCASLAALPLAKCAWLDGDAKHCVTLLLNEGRGVALLGIPIWHRAATWELLCAAAVDAGMSVAEESANHAIKHAQRFPLPHNVAYAELARGHERRAERLVMRAVHHYDRAAELFAMAGMQVEQAYALGHAVRLLSATGHRDGAADRADLGREVARRCAAQTLLAWFTCPEPRAVDAAPVEVAVLGELTRREREIALLVSSGMKRKDIAEALEISLRTVDVHLTRIYRKTGVRSQVQLALALTQETGF